MAAEKRSVSAPVELWREVDARMEELNYVKLAHYVQFLMEQDIKERLPHIRSGLPKQALGGANVGQQRGKSTLKDTPLRFPQEWPGSPYPLVVTDAEGKVIWFNGLFTEMCGYELPEMEGRKPGQLLQRRTTDQGEIQRVSRAIRDGTPVGADLLNYHKGGKPYWVHIEIIPLKDSGGNVTNFVAIEREITESEKGDRAIADELKQALNGVRVTLSSYIAAHPDTPNAPSAVPNSPKPAPGQDSKAILREARRRVIGPRGTGQ